MDDRSEFWDVCNHILAADSLWDDDRQPELIADDDYPNVSLISAKELEKWKVETQITACVWPISQSSRMALTFWVRKSQVTTAKN
jgi:hypothetical protein